MIDERVLEAASYAFWQTMGELDNVDLAISAAIEAYEAAKPDPWRPIKEAADCPDTVMVCLDDSRGEIFTATRYQGGNWHLDDDSTLMLSHQDLVERGAMFRTIDPPNQDASQGAGDARQQPTEGKSSAS